LIREDKAKKMLKELIIIIVLLVIGVAVVLPVLNSLSEELPDGSESQFIKSVIPMLPVFFGIAILVSVIGMFTGGGNSYYEDVEDEEIVEEEEVDETPLEQTKKARKSAYEILAERYAKGEISDEDYTEAMARL
jgi:uncharacterized membrane protein